MSMDLHTDRVDRTIGDSDNFGKIWGWTAAIIFLLVAIGGSTSGSGDALGWTLMAAIAAVFPGVMIAALLKGVSIFFEG